MYPFSYIRAHPDLLEKIRAVLSSVDLQLDAALEWGKEHFLHQLAGKEGDGGRVVARRFLGVLEQTHRNEEYRFQKETRSLCSISDMMVSCERGG